MQLLCGVEAPKPSPHAAYHLGLTAALHSRKQAEELKAASAREHVVESVPLVTLVHPSKVLVLGERKP